MIGFAITIFYTLLLSISERINFNAAYIISAAGVVVLIVSYCKSIYRKLYLVLSVGGILAGLYAYLFTVLQSENYALLMGSIGIFVLLALVMFITRKVNWYSVRFEDGLPTQTDVVEQV